MRTNESPRAKSSATSAGSSRLAGGIIGVVATGRPDAGSGGDTVAGGARVASLAADFTAGACALERAPVAVLTAASTAGDAEPRAGLVGSDVGSSRAVGLCPRASTGTGVTATKGGNSTSTGTD